MPAPDERRASERFQVTADTTCTFVSPVVEDFGPARIKNISMEGIGLLMTRRVEVGALVAVTLTNPAKGFVKTVLVRVAHATPRRKSGDGESLRKRGRSKELWRRA